MKWREDYLVGGHPAVDLVNTVGDEGKTREIEWLSNWAVFRSWASCSDLSSDLVDEIDAVPLQQQRVIYSSVIELRTMLFSFLGSLVDRSSGMPIPTVPIDLENRIHQAIERSNFAPGVDGGMIWTPRPHASKSVVDTLALSIEALLRNRELSRIRQCRRCTWFFIDRGRGKGRQWCSMQTCGNRAKVARFRNTH